MSTTRRAAALIVIAKAPVAGRSKTRLTPPCSPDQAAALAQAALRDTLEAVAAVPGRRRILVLEGEPGPWLPNGFEVVPQRAGGLDERLTGAFATTSGPAFLVGMDTPQITPEIVERGVAELERPDVDAVLGAAEDGGYWSIGLERPDDRVFRGVPMSVESTGEAQRARLTELGLRHVELEPLLDVDTIADALIVAEAAPRSNFAQVLKRLELAAPPKHEQPPTP